MSRPHYKSNSLTILGDIEQYIYELFVDRNMQLVNDKQTNESEATSKAGPNVTTDIIEQFLRMRELEDLYSDIESNFIDCIELDVVDKMLKEIYEEFNMMYSKRQRSDLLVALPILAGVD